MATKHEPIRRNDVIRCEKCGEDYSVTYKRCPFCDERPTPKRKTGGGGSRVAGGKYGYSSGVNPLQVAGVVLSLVLIIAALYIVFDTIGPLLGRGREQPSSQSSSTSQSTPASQSKSSSVVNPPSSVGSSSTPMASDPAVDPAADPEPEPTVPVINVTSLSLDRSDVTLTPDEGFNLHPTVYPAGAIVTWSSSDSSLATVNAEGRVTNVNTRSSQRTVTITASAGDKTASCIVRCNGGSKPAASTAPSTTPSVTPSTPPSTTTSTPASGTGTVTNAELGLRVRSGAGSSYEAIASLLNGTSVKILEDSGSGWYKISFIGADGKTTEGYVSKDYITVR